MLPLNFLPKTSNFFLFVSTVDEWNHPNFEDEIATREFSLGWANKNSTTASCILYVQEDIDVEAGFSQGLRQLAVEHPMAMVVRASIWTT